MKLHLWVSNLIYLSKPKLIITVHKWYQMKAASFSNLGD